MRKVDIYGTLGPSCKDAATIRDMFAAGMAGMRLNLSHSSLKECGEWLEQFRKGAEEAGVKPKLLVDLQGPELRTGNDKPWSLPEGAAVTLGSGGIPVPELIFASMEAGQQILLDDGKILMEAEEVSRGGEGKSNSRALCRVVRGGMLKSRKSIALPGLSIHPPTLTESDKENLSLAGECGVTGVMLPFVRDGEDLRHLRKILKQENTEGIEIFAKIENMEGVNKLPELLPHADCIVIARGDLGNAMPLWELPKIQYQIGRACKKAGKPYMVVTQMLASMEQAAVPTRAEVSDIFYAVLHGASCVMLTGETAAGSYPVEAMKYMCRTVRSAAEME